MNWMTLFSNLPGYGKVAGIAFCGFSLMSLGYLLASGNFLVLGILIGAILLITLFFFLTSWISKKSQQKKANKLGSDLSQHNTGAPSSVNAAAQKAKLDELRRVFEEGVGKFRQAGKDLYSLPWYLLVGESGSGKTEAIRHSNIGFPPGLQDEFQGAGGTINMNWWFTNQAIILDTAGRLLFEGIEAGKTSEWKEFLGLLTRTRPDCPINGLILTIPADSLISKTEEQLLESAKKIAVQFDEIQRALDVRFPVFVLVTKCDLIPGFREFFEGLDDPAKQHQMLGWSNPETLDTPFDPGKLSTYLNAMLERLRQTRFRLAGDLKEESVNQRLENMDALYAFPEQMADTFPRLKIYLEAIFVAGEWARKPLFLRGIYFSSSMQEGAALDQELARALQLPIDQLPQGKVWEKNRSFFLKDVCQEKVFLEKGLVTRATNTADLLRRQRFILFSAAGLLLVLLVVLGWLGSTGLKNSVGREASFWSQGATPGNWLGQNERYYMPIVEEEPGRGYTWYGDSTVRVPGQDPMLLTEFHDRLFEIARQPLEVPFIFKPAYWFGRIFSSESLDRVRAQQTIFERGVVIPLLDGFRKSFAELPVEDWDRSTFEAFKAAIRLEGAIAARETGLNPKPEDTGDIFQPIFKSLLPDTDPGVLPELFKETYASGSSGFSWAPLHLSSGITLRENRTMSQGLRSFQEWSALGNADTRKAFSRLTALEQAGQEWLTAEQRYLQTANRYGFRNLDLPELQLAWENLDKAGQKLQELWKPLGGNKTTGSFSLQNAFEANATKATEIAGKLRGELLETIKQAGPEDVEYSLLSEMATQLERNRPGDDSLLLKVFPGSTVEDIQEIDRRLFAQSPRGNPWFVERYKAEKKFYQYVSQPEEWNEEITGKLALMTGQGQNPIVPDGNLGAVEGYSHFLSDPLPRAHSIYLEKLANAYINQTSGALKQILSFPISGSGSGTPLTLEDFPNTIEYLSKCIADIQNADLTIFPADPAEKLEKFQQNLKGVAALSNAIFDADKKRSRKVTIHLPTRREANEIFEAYQRQLDFSNTRWRFVEDQFTQMRGPDGPTRIRNLQEPLKLGDFTAYADDLRFTFFNPANPDDQAILRASGTWSPLRMLFFGSVAASPREDAKIWDAVFEVPKADQKYALIMTFIFEDEIPFHPKDLENLLNPSKL